MPSSREKEVSVAGRMMVKRVMGKASFFKIQDREGLIQVYVARDSIGEEAYADFKKMDIGDILGVSGYVFQTKTGETTIHAESVTLLSKSLKPLPEKFHGLTDVDTRYRQRYVDLIVNPERARHLHQALPDHQRDPPLPGRQRLHGSGDPHAGHQRRRRRRAPL